MPVVVTALARFYIALEAGGPGHRARGADARGGVVAVALVASALVKVKVRGRHRNDGAGPRVLARRTRGEVDEPDVDVDALYRQGIAAPESPLRFKSRLCVVVGHDEVRLPHPQVGGVCPRLDVHGSIALAPVR